MHQIDEPIVDIGLGLFCEAADHSRQQPVRDLAECNETGRDYKCLQISVWADQFGQRLHLLD